MKRSKKVGNITCYINRPGMMNYGPAMDQRIARIPVFFSGGSPVVSDIIQVEKDYYIKVDDNPLRYVLKTISKGEVVEAVCAIKRKAKR
jgi:hypothetical protein